MSFNKTQEALKMAIEALEKSLNSIEEETIDSIYVRQSIGYAIQACKEALVQPAQEPVAWNEEEFNAIAYAYRTCPAHEIKIVSDRYQELVNYVLSITHPAPSWQGLSDDEINYASYGNTQSDGFCDGAKWAEQALKEKNHG